MANIVEMPKLGFDMAEGKLITWVKAENDSVEKGDILAEIETDKATVEVESTFTGIVYKHLAAEGDSLPVGEPIAVIAEKDEKVDLKALLVEIKAEEASHESEEQNLSPVNMVQTKVEISDGDTNEKLIKASPVAKRVAEEHAVDLSKVKGSGPGGRIVKRDVEKVLTAGFTEKAKAPTEFSSALQKDVISEVSKLRATVGNRMLESRQTIPHFYITCSYNVSALLEMREQMNDGLIEDDRISINDFIIRAVALALRDSPNLNASINQVKITKYASINIGVAVAVENGLLTVVIRNADTKSLRQISSEAKAMIQRVKAGRVKQDDIRGSTFTISNLGMFDVEDFVAIINPPEAAILAIGSAKEVPIVKNGKLEIGWRMKATLSADHRITDGAGAAQFMQHIRKFLEQPWRLIT